MGLVKVGRKMGQDNGIPKILQDLKIIEKLYEFIRFVDPVKKKVMEYRGSSVRAADASCFDFWEKGKMCDNCVSIRAYNENQTFVKVEYSPGKIYMTTAIPVEVGNKRIVIELLKDATNSMILGNGDYDNSSSAIYAMIDNMNMLALKDHLTGVYNRRYINEKLPIDLINAAFSKQSLGIIMADIDFFKKVNDTYGHLTGDAVLKSFAETLAANITRESDWVARYGGEEFFVCLPGAELKRTIEIAEKMRKAVENQSIIVGAHEINITASFGVCSMKVTEGLTLETLVQCADQRLYEAKSNGRNRVEAKQ